MQSKIKRFIGALGKRLGFLIALLVSLIIGFLLHAALTPSHVGSHGAASETQAKAAQSWTCSMHPQIRSDGPGLCPICNMDLIPVAQNESQQSLREFSTSPTAQALMDIRTDLVRREFVTAEIRMVGMVDYDETRLAHIAARVPGRLDRLYVDYTGIAVKQGDHLVYLYSPELLSAQEELLQARQAVQALQASKSDLLRETTEATYQAAREKLRLLGLTAEQVDEVEQKGQTSDHLTIRSPVSGIVIDKQATEGMYVNTGTRIYTVADLSQMWIRLEAYESDLGWLRYGQDVEFRSVSYPGEVFYGKIAFIDPILDQATRTIAVRVNVPNSEGKLKPGMFVQAVVRSNLAAGGKVMDADLAGKWISPMHPEIVKDHPGTCDICGMPLVRTESLGYVSVDPQKADKPLVIPASAPLITGTRAVVYIKVPDADTPTYVGREIVLGPRAGDDYIVAAGLTEGEAVVTRGNFKIDSALQISANPSMMIAEITGEPDEDLPALSSYQIGRVLTAVKAVERAVATGRTTVEIRHEFEKIAQRLDVVDTDALTGRAKLVWQEYAMRLSNDAAEGMQVESPPALARLSRSLAQTRRDVLVDLGLTPAEDSFRRLDQRFIAPIEPLYRAYLAVQKGLAGDDLAATQQAVRDAQAAVERLDVTVLDGDNQERWAQAVAALKSILTKLAAAQDFDAARQAFALFSEELMPLARQFGSPIDGPLYQIHCPMAFNNRGASWLQRHSNVENPYFGAVMFRCGQVERVIGQAEPVSHELANPEGGARD